MQVRTEGHTGGGLVVLDDKTLLFSVADQGDSYEDGRAYSQDPSVYLSKILRINIADGVATMAANGVRGAQRLVIHGSGNEARLSFVENGGWVAEELDSVLLSELFSGGEPLNFGYGRNKDGKAREGTIYIDPTGNSIARIPGSEPGFVSPVTDFGREKKVSVGASGPVISAKSFQRITALFGDLPSGEVYAVTSPLAVRGQPTFRVALVDSEQHPVTLLALTTGRSTRADPRFFNFPDGSAGVLLEPTGEFFRLTEVK